MQFIDSEVNLRLGDAHVHVDSTNANTVHVTHANDFNIIISNLWCTGMYENFLIPACIETIALQYQQHL